METEKDQARKDDAMVQTAYQHLIDTYLASPHRKKVELINKAFNFARKAHEGVRRLSGEPYIMHPLAVAQIACGEIGLGSTSICAALLHDVVEDTEFTVADLENIFGPKIAQIVDGLTKISGGIFGDKASAQAESFRKLLLTMSDDIRVILIKISDRLHNMRTLGSQPKHKQYKIAGETLYIYAPLAYRLGLNRIKEELEDLSFQYEQPEVHDQICQQIDAIRPALENAYEKFIIPIREKLDAQGYHYEIKARIKRPYSVWSKMQHKHVAFNEIYDLLAVRIIFDPLVPDNEEKEQDDCFRIYRICTKTYKAHPDRFRDWISNPKSNGYQALHTTLMSEQGRWVEVQIRSRRMDDMAEHGFAAHWKYKEKEADGDEELDDSITTKESELEKWVGTIKELLDDPQPSAMDFLSTIKLNLYASEILVITPKGEFKTMPADCTVLDFAFSIHTFLGTHCMGAKVNHQLEPINYRLKSGDQVEILTGATARVEPSWLDYTTTAKARNKVEAYLRRMNREQQKRGEELVETWCEQHELEMTSQLIDCLCKVYDRNSRDSLFQQLGAGTIVLTDDDVENIQKVAKGEKQKKGKGWKRLIPFWKPKEATDGSTAAPAANDEPMKIDRKKPIVLNEENLSRFTICPQCHPIPGDQVLGYLDDQNRVIIHKRKCPIADQLKTSDGNHILAAEWDTHRLLHFAATIHIEGIDRVGILRSLTDVITQQFNVNVHRLTIDTRDGLFQGDIELSVHDTEDVETIIKNLKSIDGLEEVTRIS
ncbi:MAG: bifunctional (p)ppGpp synthetase/guanosine-3',5'-bis(diphosphate) 3'-pyrophosphohydrolase [Bacteroidaceae bacterium]|nr:bifunctional (p)ppGpp synthetase/guanosine-3',5'-bis(diphosphate) 3'-pyrophosphohydrolase [Bacteroidaceae bacterium]